MEENEVIIDEVLLHNDIDDESFLNIEEEDYLHPEIGPDIDY